MSYRNIGCIRMRKTATLRWYFGPRAMSFRRTRGRISFDLRPDGGLIERGPGPSDRSEESEGKWQLDANQNLVFYQGSPKSSASRILRLASADMNRLVVMK